MAIVLVFAHSGTALIIGADLVTRALGIRPALNTVTVGSPSETERSLVAS